MERSLLARETEAEQQNDEDKLFFLSLYKELKKVPENNRLMTKIELLNVVHRAQAFGTYHSTQPLHHPHAFGQSFPHHSGYTAQSQSSHIRAHQTNPSPGASSSFSDTQAVHQTHLNMQPYVSISGCNTHTLIPPSVVPPPTPSHGTESQVSDTQSEFIDMFE